MQKQRVKRIFLPNGLSLCATTIDGDVAHNNLVSGTICNSNPRYKDWVMHASTYGVEVKIEGTRETFVIPYDKVGFLMHDAQDTEAPTIRRGRPPREPASE